jgi:glycosyltransferase involved in cell wall biosynthesis
MKVVLFGTHPKQFNGYSKVVYEISKVMAVNHKDIEFHVFGFQNFYANERHRPDTPFSEVTIYDAFNNENPKQQGFGIEQIEKYVADIKPDVCVVYNDALVIQNCVSKIRSAGVEDIKIIAYFDQVYLCQKKEFIDFVNKKCDFVLAFTPYWETIIKEQGITLPTDYLQHGINPDIYYPIPKKVARRYFGMSPDDFIILNLNRNQPRKRWDTCLKAFAEVVSRFPESNIKMLVATAVQGGWNLLEVYERELKKRNVSMETGMKHLIVLNNPQRITDEETNILYNVADIGINTCDGEGFGLCNFEQAAVGIPQVIPKLGGFMDFFDDESAYLVEPTIAYYVDSSRDAVAGEALMSDYMDFVDGICAYYQDVELREKHGKNARANILKKYAWKDITAKLVKLCKNLKPEAVKEEPKNTIPDVQPNELLEEVEEIDITTINKLVGSNETVPPNAEPLQSTLHTAPSIEPAAPSKKKKKSMKELEALKKQIETILSSFNSDDDDE